MNLKTLQDLALLLVYPLVVLSGIYAYCLWGLVFQLHKKLEDLHANCRQVHQHLDVNFFSAHRVEHQSLWEALHHHEHGPRAKPGRVIKIIGRQETDT